MYLNKQIKMNHEYNLINLYEGIDFYIYQLEIIPKGPWLDNGATKIEFHHIDKLLNHDELLEIEQEYEMNDGGTRGYIFTNKKRVVIPHNNKDFGCNEILRYDKIVLKDIGIENKIGEKILQKYFEKYLS